MSRDEIVPLHVMSPICRILCILVCLCMGALPSGPVAAQTAPDAGPHQIVEPPGCRNNLGEAVRFIDAEGGRTGIAAGVARRNPAGEPVVIRSNFAAAPPEFQSFIDRHECAHHQTGDVDRPHPPRNSFAHLWNESISDCIAILRLRDEEGYDTRGLERISAILSRDMAKIGFPEVSISSRRRNLEGCFRKTEAARDIIEMVLRERGLR